MKDEKIEIGEGTKTNPFFTLQWHITERCNLQCKHCYQNENYIEEEMGFKKKIELIDKFVYFCSKIGKKPRISFTGGEPFAIKDELYSLLDYCNKKYPSIKKSVLTNGTLIKEEDISLLKNFNLDYIQISLDGGTQKSARPN